MPRPATIAVVGSLNQDLTIHVPHHPAPGETVLGTGSFTNPGGKGANQAAAAGRLGHAVAMIGRVGADPEGDGLIASLQACGVETVGITCDPTTPTGRAVITLSADGENAIVVDPGANGRVDPAQIDDSRAILAAAGVVLAQLEVPLSAVERALELATGLRILNPAPAQALPQRLLDHLDVLVPNRTELALLTGQAEASSLDAAAMQARTIRGPRAVVVTLGADGALLVEGESSRHIPSPTIDPVDTTGAGDAFCGALAGELATGATLPEAVRTATCAGALAATRPGAIPALPDAAELRALRAQAP